MYIWSKKFNTGPNNRLNQIFSSFLDALLERNPKTNTRVSKIKKYRVAAAA